MDDLMKACPFCGSTEIGHIAAYGGVVYTCIDCGARGPDTAVGDPEQEQVWIDACSAWSRRTLEAELAEARGEVGLIVEWLREQTLIVGLGKYRIGDDLATAIASGAYKGQTDD